MGFMVILISIVVLGISAGIEKIKLPFEKKKLIILASIGILSSILLVQKIKEPGIDESFTKLSDTLYTLPAKNVFPQNYQKYSLINPLNETLDMQERFLKIKIDQKTLIKSGPIYQQISGISQTGKTYTLINYLNKLINDGQNSLLQIYYIDLRDKTNKILMEYNQYQNFKSLFQSDCVSETPAPILIIDHWEEYLKYHQSDILFQTLYRDFCVSFVFVSNYPTNMKISNKTRTKEFLNFRQKDRVSTEEVQMCSKWMDTQFDYLNDFLENENVYGGFLDFCEVMVNNQVNKIQENANLQELLSILIKEQLTLNNGVYMNSWVPYGRLKQNIPTQLHETIQITLENQFIEILNGQYRFFSRLGYTASVLIHKYKLQGKLEELEFQFDLN